MIQIPMKSTGSYDRTTISSVNDKKTEGAKNRATLQTVLPDASAMPADPVTAASAINRSTASPASAVNPAPTVNSIPAQPSFSFVNRPIPSLCSPVQKGQKIMIDRTGALQAVDVALGWNLNDFSCDIDLSAFLLDASGKVPGDDWFVFYGQTESPDKSVCLNVNGSAEDREIASVNFTKLQPSIRKIVFVLTINEALRKRLHFGMVKDAYIRLTDPSSRKEICSFLLTDYYTNVTSMMLGEIYQHNGIWKFHAIGNGVAEDLAGLCSRYGVETN